MQRTSVAGLKARLSHFLRLAQQGETIEVQSHRRPVARIVAAGEAAAALLIPPERPVSELRGLRGVRLPAGVDPLAVLLRDRGRR